MLSKRRFCEPEFLVAFTQKGTKKDPKKHVRQTGPVPHVFYAKQSKSFFNNTGVVDRTAALARGGSAVGVMGGGHFVGDYGSVRIATPSGTISCKPLTRNPSHAFLSPLPVTT